MPAAKDADAHHIPGWLAAPFMLGAMLALGGGFWDDAWHTERGRDSFFIAPHIAIYGGISLAGGALGLWALRAARRRGAGAVLSDRPLALALLSITVTLSSAPVDNLWHLAFGRDAVIWSPPHLLGIVGTAGLAAAMLVELEHHPAGWARSLRWAAGALMLAAFSFLVVEYDTDVPQFPALWYLPVLALGSSFALTLIRLATGERLAASRAAAIHLLFFGLVALFLLAQGFDTPKAPLIIAGAIVLDLSANRGLGRSRQAALYVAAIYLLYIPALNLLGSGVRLSSMDVLLGVPLSFGAVLAVLTAVGRPRAGHGGVPRLMASASLALALLVVPAAPALAHDPGQGPPEGSFDFDTRLTGPVLTLTAMRNQPDCAELSAPELVARRGGELERGTLARDSCRFEGSVRLPREGRWFVYVDTQRQGKTLESWIQVKAGEGQGHSIVRERFAYVAEREPAGVVKWVAGTAMYAAVVAFLIAITALVRSAAPAPPRGGRSEPPLALSPRRRRG